jgi:PTS system fructose-specific IIC component
VAPLGTEALHDANPLLLLALVIAVGVASGALARRLQLPAITGQILAGVCLGRAGLQLFSRESLEGLVPLTIFALSLMSITVGAHLNLRRLRNAGRRLFLLLLVEATVTPGVVYLAMRSLGGAPPRLAALLAAVSIATAPATVVALVKEARAKGVFVKTLVAAVALNNISCIFLFEVVRSLAVEWPAGAPGAVAWLLAPAGQILPALLIGGGTALAMDVVTRFTVHKQALATAAAVSLVLAAGLAVSLDVSPLLTCLFLGIVQTNVTATRDKLVDSLFADFEPAILTVFFTLAGMHLTLEHAALAGLVALLFFGARLAGKVAAGEIAMRAAGATDRVRRNLGLALAPQAGVAVGLVVLLQEDASFSDVAGIFSAVVLTAVVLNEIVGPLLTRLALERSGEVGKDRMRLIDFLQEENVVTDFHAATKREAIEKLVDLLLATHSLEKASRKELLASVLAREAEASTSLGAGLAVPHGILPKGTPMAGVMAISREGLDFPTPDGRPVHCIVLLATSEDERERHLQVLAMLARRVGSDPAFQTALFNAGSPAHVSELLQGEASEGFNYFLEGEPQP